MMEDVLSNQQIIKSSHQIHDLYHKITLNNYIFQEGQMKITKLKTKQKDNVPAD